MVVKGCQELSKRLSKVLKKGFQMFSKVVKDFRKLLKVVNIGCQKFLKVFKDCQKSF